MFRPVLVLFMLGGISVSPWPGREPLRFCLDRSIEPYRPLVVTAFWRWKWLVGLEARETRDCGGPRTIAYRLGEVSPPAMGLAFGPPPSFAEPQAGDIMISNRGQWDLQADMLQWLLLHETGHAFGLGESEEGEGLMNPHPLYPLHTVPSQREIKAVMCAYEGVCY